MISPGRAFLEGDNKHFDFILQAFGKDLICTCVYNQFVGVHHLTQTHHAIPYSWELRDWILAKKAGSPPLYNTYYTGSTVL